MTHPSPKRNIVPKAVLMRSGLVSLTTARPVNTAHPKTTVNSARPMTNVFNKAHLTVRRPINNKTTTKNSNFNQRVNTVSGKNVNTARPKAVVNAARPKAVLNVGNPQMDLQDQGVIDSRCSRHMTGNMSYLTEFEEIDGGYVAFGGNPKGGKITGRVPRKNNMYSVDLKNIVPKGGLTCLFAKATSDESKLWHRRLGHINFKTMNKLVKGNLVRGLPLKLFENDQTCVACQKGKQHRASCTRACDDAGTKACDDAGKARMETVPGKDYILLPLWPANILFSQNSKSSPEAEFKPLSDSEKKVDDDQEKDDNVSSTNNVNTASDGNNTNNVNAVSSTINAVGIEVNVVGAKTSIELLDEPNMPELEDIVYSNNDEDVGAEVDMNNLDAFMRVSPIPTTRIHKDHPVEQIIGDLNSAPQTRRMTKNLEEHGLFSSVQQRTNHKGFQNCLFACFLSQEEPKKEQEGRKRHCDKEQSKMDVKSAFLYGKIEEEVYVYQPPGFEDLDFPDRVYKVEKALYGLHQAPRACSPEADFKPLSDSEKMVDDDQSKDELLQFKFHKSLNLGGDLPNRNGLWLYMCLQEHVRRKRHCDKEQSQGFEDPDSLTEFQRGNVDKNLFIRRDKGDILHTSTPMETQKPLLMDEDGEEVDVHLYRSMIGSLMYLTSSRPNIMFAVCQPKLGLWYPKDSPFDLVVYTDSDYVGASLDWKSTIRGCQFLGCRLISWQCKKQTMVANSIIEAEYVAASSCCGQVLWIQNQLLDYSAGDSKLMLLGINLLLLLKVNAARHNLQLLVKTVNGEVQLQALVYGKKIIVTEASIRRNLQLDDEEGMDCLPNATIFEELTRMGYEKLSQKLTFYKAFFSHQWKFLIHTVLQCLSAKTTAWNEFSSIMAFAIICLATNQKFNFSKYIFENMVKNLENVSGKFLMYPRFVQVFLNQQLDRRITHKRIYVTPSHTKKIFANMRRQGKDFSGRVTPLFPTMVVQAQEEMGEGSEMPTDPHHTPIITQPSSSQPQRNKKSRRPKEKDTEIPQSSVPSDPTNVADEAINEEPIKKLEKKGGSRTHKLKRLYKIGRSARVVSSDEASLGDQKDASKQGRKVNDIDADAEITLVNETQGRHDDDLITADPVTTAGEVVTTTNVEVSFVSPTAATITNVELTLAQTLAELKSARPKTKGVVMQEPRESTPTISLQLSSQAKGQGLKDKGKAKMIEPEKPLKKKDQIKFDEEEALRLQAEFDEEDRLVKEKAQQVEEANIAWDDIQAKIDANYQLAERLLTKQQS
ncbi:putative ribonuclease H-like domain-containing protein [Tanacetum coccineum]|uniref:Ribonuclease H-like domain-containing protein n=1 Tax=Tanacetum coccineum TaxID=301880 RepID=A0ABQ5JC75_9ASTR